MNTDRFNIIRSSTQAETSLSIKPRQRQRGLSSFGFLIVVSTALFFLLCSFKLVPIYVQNWTVKSILDDIHNEIEGQSKPIAKSQIKTALLKRFSINQLAPVIPESIEFEKVTNGYITAVNYEIRLSLVGNIDAVVKFDQNKVEISRP